MTDTVPSWQMHDQEFRSVLSLSAFARYEYFIKRVADWQQLWSLHATDGWVLFSDDAGHECIPVWPHERFALACATDKWTGSIAGHITLDEWFSHWLPGMERDERLVCVFPTPDGKGPVVTPERLQADIQEELLKYEA